MIVTTKKRVIKSITTYEYKNKHFKRIDKHFIAKRKDRHRGVLIFSKQFKTGSLLKPFSSAKKQGKTLFSVQLAINLSRLGGMSIYSMQPTGHSGMDDNTMYRLMNNPLVDWKRLLLSFTKQFIRCESLKGESDKKPVKSFVMDDTDIEKIGKTFEGVSKIFSHVTHSFSFGCKMLTLCYRDGKSPVRCCLSQHRESRKKEYGLNKKQQERQFRKERKDSGYFRERYEELDEENGMVAVKMLKRVVRSNLLASYVLMDRWFVSDYMLRAIRTIRGGMLHIVGMCRMDRRRFKAGNSEYNTQTVIKMNEVKKEKVHLSRQYHSKYIADEASYNGTAVKLFHIKYKNAKHRTLLLTADLSLSFARAMEVYQIRWSIEVMYKECKQYLRPGKAQNADFYGQIADATLTMITYTILTLYKRFEAYETLGALFRHTQAEMLEKRSVKELRWYL